MPLGFVTAALSANEPAEDLAGAHELTIAAKLHDASDDLSATRRRPVQICYGLDCEAPAGGIAE
jgi:hypothetical protein